MQQAVGLLRSDQQGEEAAATLLKLLDNISQQPDEVKFRRIRLSNARIQRAVVDVSGGLELLQASFSSTPSFPADNLHIDLTSLAIGPE